LSMADDTVISFVYGRWHCYKLCYGRWHCYKRCLWQMTLL